jgi:hypothetical protein
MKEIGKERYNFQHIHRLPSSQRFESLLQFTISKGSRWTTIHDYSSPASVKFKIFASWTARLALTIYESSSIPTEYRTDTYVVSSSTSSFHTAPVDSFYSHFSLKSTNKFYTFFFLNMLLFFLVITIYKHYWENEKYNTIFFCCCIQQNYERRKLDSKKKNTQVLLCVFLEKWKIFFFGFFFCFTFLQLRNKSFVVVRLWCSALAGKLLLFCCFCRPVWWKYWLWCEKFFISFGIWFSFFFLQFLMHRMSHLGRYCS